MSDNEIVQEIVSGNSAAFQKLMEKYQNRIFRTAMGFTHSKEDAEDITQDVFVKVFQSLDTFKGNAELSTWLYRITVNTAINFANTLKRRSILQSLETILFKTSEDKTPLEKLEISEREARIKKAIDTLPDAQRTAFILSNYEDLPQKEIAAIMQKSEGSIEQLLIRAKKNLQKKLSVKA